MGSPKQVEALVSLYRKVSTKDKSFPKLDEAVYRTQAAAAPNNKIQEEFKRLNDALGFNRTSSPCTDRQAELIRDLEGQVTGGAESDWTVFRSMTYQDADVRIKRLLGDLKSRNTSTAFDSIVGAL